MDKYLECYRSNFNVFRLQTQEQSVRENDATETRFDKQNYLEEKHIFDTFTFFIGHLIVYQPADPIQYLYKLLDDCMLFRSGLKEPRLFWMKRHIDSIFQSIDSSNSGFVSLDSYRSVMKILNVHSYNSCPTECAPGYVDRQTFYSEVMCSLEYELMRIINGII